MSSASSGLVGRTLFSARSGGDVAFTCNEPYILRMRKEIRAFQNPFWLRLDYTTKHVAKFVMSETVGPRLRVNPPDFRPCNVYNPNIYIVFQKG